MTFADFVQLLVRLVDTAIIPLLYALAFIAFLIGMVRYFFMGGEEARTAGKQFMLWSIIGFVVLFATWGIVRLFLTVLPGYTG